MQRIGQAARYMPLEDLSLSPQCGFASHRKGTALTFADQEAKLRLVLATATEVWGEFTAP
jgi:5-methyltetrahydropteroyltriglutamate--homocysteine methyltransferase